MAQSKRGKGKQGKKREGKKEREPKGSKESNVREEDKGAKEVYAAVKIRTAGIYPSIEDDQGK